MKRERIVELDKRLLWHPYTQMRRYIDEVDPVVVARAEGIYLHDADGTRFVDGNSSWWVSLLGHNHPRLMEALRRQSETLDHCALAGMVHEPAVRLAEALLPICGRTFTRVFYSDDGSTAVEAAVRMAHQHWRNLGRPRKRRFVTLAGAFHGETVGAASVSGSPVFHEALSDLLFERILLPSPSGAANRGAGEGAWHEEAFDRARVILEERADEIAAVIVEPLVQGAAGMLMYPPEYLASMRALCDRLDVLLIADEVFVGYWRTGRFLAQHNAGIEADIVCLAKGFSGGVLPMAATVVNDRVFSSFLGGPGETLWYGHSFTGNPLGCAVALETLRVLAEDGVVEGLGPGMAAMERGLDSLREHPWVADPRRTGMIAAFTLADPSSRDAGSDYLSDAGWRFYAAARARGVLLRPMGNVVYFVPPLIITVEQIEALFSVVRESLAATF